MEIDVGTHIAEVLFEKDNVSIPGLGAFETHYQEAVSDQVQGKVLPPTKELKFKYKSSGNDGFLIKYIKEKHTLSYSDAQKVVSEYVSDIKNSIDEKEIVVFPNIGRLYKDFEEELQFLPDKENFNKSTFGLPAIDLLPPIRESVVKEPVDEPKITEEAITGNISNWFERNVISIAAITLTLVAFAVYYVYFQDDIRPNSERIIINESPSRNSIVEDGNQKKTVEAPEIGFNQVEEKASGDTKESGEPAPTPYESIEKNIPKPKPYTALISVGEFSLSIDADRMAVTLKKEGFKPITHKVGKNTRVLVEMEYDKEEEIETIITNLKRKMASEDVKLIEKKSNEL